MGQKNLDKFMISPHVGQSSSKRFLVCPYMGQNESQTNFTFMGLCVVNVFKQNQHDAMLHSGIYYYKCSTCFRRLLRPSSGARNFLHSVGYLSSFFYFLPLSRVSCSNSLMIAVRSRKSSTNTRCCVYSFELLMTGGGTA
jgi:hypothetical protein